MRITRKDFELNSDCYPTLSPGGRTPFGKSLTRLKANILYAIGRRLARTKLGVFITAHSYVHDSYEWYRLLIYRSGRSIEDIRTLMHADDEENRLEWLFARSNASEMHLDDDELCEVVSYLED